MITQLLRHFALASTPLALLAPGATAYSQIPGAETTADVDMVSVREAIEASRHQVFESESGFEARNSGQAWHLNFDQRGFLAEPDAQAWTWGLQLESYGFVGQERRVGAIACATAEGGRVSYAWDDNLEEWFINDARGLEHGFTVFERPEIGDSSEARPLTFRLNIRGELTPELDADRRSVRFVDERGSTALTYAGLTVFDADGETLPARIDVLGNMLSILVDESDARYPLTIDPVAQQAYIKASVTNFADNFGISIGISGDTMVVGARVEDGGSTGINGDQTDQSAIDSGAAYVFVRTGSTWTQQAYLKASNAEAGDEFGRAVSIDGDTIVVGADREASGSSGVDADQSDNTSGSSGAVYVFTRSGTTWTQEAYIKASNADLSGAIRFGSSQQISGDTLIVGAFLEGGGSTGVNGDQTPIFNTAWSGAAYVFVRAGTVWTQEAYLKASNTRFDTNFGITVDVHNDTAVVGSWREDNNASGVNGPQCCSTLSRSGAAYVFVRNGTTWSQEAYLKASNPGVGDKFGESVTLWDDTIIVGANGEASGATGINGDQTDDSAPGAGAAYAFVRTGTTWTQQAYIKASNTDADDKFSLSLSLTGDHLVVGALREDSDANGVNGDGTDNSASRAGSAYTYARVGTVWSQSAYLKAGDSDSEDLFGFSVASSTTGFAVGSPGEDSSLTMINGDQTNNTLSAAGAAYFFELEPAQEFTTFCFGDGGDQLGCTDCPCSNNATLGSGGGCLNSSGMGTRLYTSGSASLSLLPGSVTDLRFSAQNAPPNTLCVLNSGDDVAPNNPANVCFGLGSGLAGSLFDGLRCSVGNTLRHGGRPSNELGDVGTSTNAWGGESSPTNGIGVVAGFIAGQTRYFQVIHRDNISVNCMTGLNTSQAIGITFAP